MELTTEVDGVRISADYAVTDQEIQKYLAYMAQKHGRKISDIERMKLALLDEEKVDVDVVFRERRFERIRRITGYLVGSTDRWNDAKRAEEKDRVKHGLMAAHA